MEKIVVKGYCGGTVFECNISRDKKILDHKSSTL